VEVEAHGRDDRDDAEDEPELAVVPRVGERTANPVDHARGRVPCDRPQLVVANEREGGEHGEEADRVEREADSGPDESDQQPRDRRADDAGPVEEAGVERDRVGQLAWADHLECERLSAGSIERERDSTERGQRVDDRERRGARKRDDGEGDRDRHRGGLRRHH
jgi:hypothetical protein